MITYELSIFLYSVGAFVDVQGASLEIFAEACKKSWVN